MWKSLLADQKARWQRGDRVRVEIYVAKHPDLRDHAPGLAELIQSEIRLRQSEGEVVDIDLYRSAYPECQAWLTPPAENFATQLLETTAAESPPAAAMEVNPFETVMNTSAEHGTVTAFENLRYPQVPGFELLSELGRGGMGVVYKARQKSTKRMVALKIVRNEMLDMLAPSSRSTTLERFHTEAQAAACLQHDNVVSVYEVGEVPSTTLGASPLHYYAMRFVKGESLFEILRDGPLENRRAAEYMQKVAIALQFAHEQGVLHRDLKPHNIMVEDGNDRPLVTDFGLAKFVDGQNSITYAGQVMGTPSYMSPEQAQDAASVTAAADQYSIGATLYHLLTGRPPFQAASISETIRQIIDKQPVAPRQLNTAIHRDLETICLKTLHKDTARRYASCQELADDLQRFLDGRPILARPVSPMERGWRWCKRNPIPASLSLTVSLLAVAFLVAIVVGYRNTSAALAVSESRLQKALSVVDELFTRVSEDELLNEPGMQPLREELLERALKHYEYFLTESGSQQKLGDEVAAAHFRVGMIYQWTRKLSESERELNAACAQQIDLLKADPDNPVRLKALADTCNALGSVYSKTFRLAEAIERLTEAVQIRQRLVDVDKAEPEYQRLLSNAIMNLGLVQISNEAISLGIDAMRSAQTMREQLLRNTPDFEQLKRDLAIGWYSLGKVEAESFEFEQAKDHLERAVTGFRELSQSEPRSLNHRYRLGVSLTLLGGVLSEMGLNEEAVHVFDEATLPIESLTQGNPDMPDYKVALVFLSMNRGAAYSFFDNLEKAKEAWSRALELSKELHQREPDNPNMQGDIASCLGSLGDLERRAGNLEPAKQYFEEANAVLKDLLEMHPERTWFREQMDENQAELDALTEN